MGMLKRNSENLLRNIVLKYQKMAFVSGPRQVGKTTLAGQFQKTFSQSHYFNWDVISDQKKLLAEPYFFEKIDRDFQKPFLVVFDEIHKYARWKSYLKGVFDQYHKDFRFFVTGSGRLDLFQKGGDSLFGRYFGLPLFPLTVGELKGKIPSWSEFKKQLSMPQFENKKNHAYHHLFQFSGFPEPFLRGTKTFYNLWFEERKKLLIREDIRDAANIRQISLLEMLSHLIPERIGGPLSLNSLREDIGVAFETVRDWILLLGQFYYLFQIRPYAASLARTLKKETKAYLFDWVEVADPAKRFENMVALHLYKAVSLWKAAGQANVELRYIRDKEKREVDFVLLENNRPVFLIECKYHDEQPADNLKYFQEKLKVPLAIQLVGKSGLSRKIKIDRKELLIISADKWLETLP